MPDNLDAFGRWMVKQQLGYAETQGIFAVLDNLKAQGYHDVATAVAKERLEQLRAVIDAECISYGELAELQGMVEYIDIHDVQLLEWAGVDEEEWHAAIDEGRPIRQETT